MSLLPVNCPSQCEVISGHIFSIGLFKHPSRFSYSCLFQLPVACIQRAIVIAGKLEAAVCNYTEQQIRRSCTFNHRQDGYNNSEPTEDVLESDCLSAGRVEGLDEISELYRELFRNLNFAFLEEHGDDRRLQFLMQARSLADQLISRLRVVNLSYLSFLWYPVLHVFHLHGSFLLIHSYKI